MKNTMLKGSLALVLTGLLAACGSQVGVPGAVRYDRVLTVNLNGTETVAGLQARYGGEVVAFKPQAHFALVATSRAVGLGTLSVGSASEENRGRIQTSGGAVLWTKGGAVLWTKGGAVLWTKGGAVLWTKGSYQPVPENTNNWSSIGLASAQSRLSHLGAGVKVAVVDTGVDLNLSVLQGSLAPSSEWRDYVDNDQLPNEEGSFADHGYGHGTSIATTILQVSPEVSILPMRVLAQDGSGDVANAAQAIIDAADEGAGIINLSLGMPDDSPALDAATRYAESKGALVVTSSGNDGAGVLDAPARSAQADPSLLAVGSVDQNGQVSAFSNTGAGLNLFTPGELVYSPAPQEAEAAWSGTSQSAAVASGALALGLAEGASPATVRSALISTASTVHTANGVAYTGAGRVDLAAFSQTVRP